MPKALCKHMSSAQTTTLDLAQGQGELPCWATEYDTEFISKPSTIPRGAGEMTMHPSPRWPNSFKKHYVHLEDYHALEDQMGRLEFHQQRLSHDLVEAQAQLHVWREAHQELELCVSQEQNSMMDMQQGVSELEAMLQGLKSRLDTQQHVLATTRLLEKDVAKTTQPMLAAATTQPHPQASPRYGQPPSSPRLTSRVEQHISTAAPAGQQQQQQQQQQHQHQQQQGQQQQQQLLNVLSQQLAACQAAIAFLTDSPTAAANQGAPAAAMARLPSATQRRQHSGRTALKRPPMAKPVPPPEDIEDYPEDEDVQAVQAYTRGYWRP